MTGIYNPLSNGEIISKNMNRKTLFESVNHEENYISLCWMSFLLSAKFIFGIEVEMKLCCIFGFVENGTVQIWAKYTAQTVFTVSKTKFSSLVFFKMCQNNIGPSHQHYRWE